MSQNKYPRTLHVPWSPGGTSDDKRATSAECLTNKPIVITEKMDGSNTSLEFEGCFARTHAGPPTHSSFDGFKALYASLKSYIPKGFQYFGEWMWAQHSIYYDSLPGYFLLFGIRDTYVEMDRYWYSWQWVEDTAKLFDISTTPVLFKGQVSSEKELKELTEFFMNQPSVCGGIREGVVIRTADQFPDEEFQKNVMKMVRANHVQTSEHWKNQEIIRNKLKT